MIQPGQRHLWCDEFMDFGWQFLDFKNLTQQSVGIGL